MMHIPFERILTENEAAPLIGFSVTSLRMWRHLDAKKGRAPRLPYLRLGRAIRYRPADIEAFLERGRVGEPAPPPQVAHKHKQRKLMKIG